MSSNSLALNDASASPIRPMFSVPMGSPSTSSGTTIIDSGSNGVPGHLDGPRVEVCLVGQDGLAVVDDPAGESAADRALVGEDQVGEVVARDDRPADAGGPVHR